MDQPSLSFETENRAGAPGSVKYSDRRQYFPGFPTFARFVFFEPGFLKNDVYTGESGLSSRVEEGLESWGISVSPSTR